METKVTATGESLDMLGNTISYDQSLVLEVVVPGSVVELDESLARQVLAGAFDNEEKRRTFLESLQASNEDFGGVTTVDSPNVPDSHPATEKR